MAVNLFAIHGILQILTFVILFPLGALHQPKRKMRQGYYKKI